MGAVQKNEAQLAKVRDDILGELQRRSDMSEPPDDKLQSRCELLEAALVPDFEKLLAECVAFQARRQDGGIWILKSTTIGDPSGQIRWLRIYVEVEFRKAELVLEDTQADTVEINLCEMLRAATRMTFVFVFARG